MITLIPNTSKLLTSSKAAQKPYLRAGDLASDVAQKSLAPQFGMENDSIRRVSRAKTETGQLIEIAKEHFPQGQNLENDLNEYCNQNKIVLSRPVTRVDVNYWRKIGKLEKIRTNSKHDQVSGNDALQEFDFDRFFAADKAGELLTDDVGLTPFSAKQPQSLMDKSGLGAVNQNPFVQTASSSSFVRPSDDTEIKSVSSYRSDESTTRYPKISQPLKNLIKRLSRKSNPELLKQVKTVRENETIAYARSKFPNVVPTDPSFIQAAREFKDSVAKFIQGRHQQSATKLNSSSSNSKNSTGSLKRSLSAASSVNTADSAFLRREAATNLEEAENITDVAKKVTWWRKKKKVEDSISERRSSSPEVFDNSDVGYLEQLGNNAERKKDFSKGKSYKRVARRIGNILKRS
jgi:hypothetical protein